MFSCGISGEDGDMSIRTTNILNKTTSKKKICIIKGAAGIGNRLITIAAAIDYCRFSDRMLYVDWSDGMYGKKGDNIFGRYFICRSPVYNEKMVLTECTDNTVYPEGFDVGLNCLQEEYEHVSYSISGERIRRVLRKCKIPSGLHVLLCHIVKSNRKWESKDGRIRFEFGNSLPLKLDEKIVIFADFQPPYRKKILAREVFFNKIFMERVDKWIAANIDIDNSLGVHIRSTDKCYTSSLKTLYSKIDRIVTTKRIYSIFLSTDSIKIKEMFAEKYAKLIVTIPKSFPETNEGQGIHKWAWKQGDSELKTRMFEEALSEMYILYKVKYLIYQGNSSFSQVVAIWRNSYNSYKWG